MSTVESPKKTQMVTPELPIELYNAVKARAKAEDRDDCRDRPQRLEDVPRLRGRA